METVLSIINCAQAVNFDNKTNLSNDITVK